MNHVASDLSLDHNEECLVDNPLKDKHPDELDREATIFARRCDVDVTLFKKAARIAQDPLAWSAVEGLTTSEERALERELRVHFWQQPKILKVSVVTLCFSAVIQGWAQTGINGANQTWPAEFGLSDPSSNNAFVTTKARWIFAAVNAITFLAASVVGCWISDPLQALVIGRRDRGQEDHALLGRRGAILISSCICLAALIGSACCHTWQELMACRALLGIGLGSKASITPIFGAEISPSHLRGALVMNWQLFDTCGIFLGFTANLILFRVGPLSWRFQVASACLPTICLLCLIWTIPESPRWLLKQGRLAEAYQAMCQLRETPLQAAREIFYANAQLQIEVSLLPKRRRDIEEKPTTEEPEHIENADHLNRTRTDIATRRLTRFQDTVKLTNYWGRVWQLFRNPRTRRATVAAGVVMVSQQLCGFNVLAFYSSTFFRDVNGHDNNGEGRDAVWMSWGVGLANFIFTLPAYYGIERTNTRPGGRRFLLLATYPGMLATMLAACLSFLYPNGTGRLALIGVWLFLFTLFYSLGQGPVAFAYSSEVFPLVNREVGMSFAVFINFFGAGLLTLFVPLAQVSHDGSGDGTLRTAEGDYAFSQTRLLASFVGFNALALILIFLFVPETAVAVIPKLQGQLISLSLEELNYIFGVPTLQHIAYQVQVMLPWVIRQARWLVWGYWRGKEAPLRPRKLYQWAEKKEAEREMARLSSAEESQVRQRQPLNFSRIIEIAETD